MTSDTPTGSSRREFLKTAAQKVAAGVLTAGMARAGDATHRDRNPASPSTSSLQRVPDRVFVERDEKTRVRASRAGSEFAAGGTSIGFHEVPEGGLAIDVHCPEGPLSCIILRWEHRFAKETVYLGDAWERSYGDLQWRTLQPERVLPWYFAAHNAAERTTVCCGVKTQPSALCFWTVDAEGVSLWLDLRNGGNPCEPGDRVIRAATVVTMTAPDEGPFVAVRRFCARMSPAPRLARDPICGNNNWYYAYGHDFDANAMRRDAAFLAELADGHRVRPYCVIDAGWSPGSSCPGGPWTAGRPDTFPDMPGLAADMKRLGVRPGVWIRPTALTIVDDPKRLRAGPSHDAEKPLDVSLRTNLEQIRADITRLRTWGYELIKHDFSTYDLFGRWGFAMGAEITDVGWNFADRTRTNAEVVCQLYQTLREAAGDAVLLGCNTIGHLGAGFFEVQRIGDDTSGHEWERTRRMGVNTLAFRLPQHGTFFACDPDCAPHTAQTPWALDAQWLDLVARSGTALFVSVDPRTVEPTQKAAFKAAMQLALSGGEVGGVEPLDWLSSTTPTAWRFGKQTKTYSWSESAGANPFPV